MNEKIPYIINETKPYQVEKDSISIAKKMVLKGCPDSREKSIVLTKLDEALLWMLKMPSETK